MGKRKDYKISELGKVVGGATPSTAEPDNFGGDISWITPYDLSQNNSKYIIKGGKNITQKGFKSIGNTLIPIGSVLFSSRAPIGYVAIAKNNLCTNQGFKSIIPNSRIDSDYLYYYLKLVKDKIAVRGSGTTFMEISGSVMKDIEINIPSSLEEQKKSVVLLNLLDIKISNNTRINRTLESMAKQLYDYWFVQFDFPDENGKPYKSSGGKMVWNERLKREIPEGWEVKPLNHIVSENKGGDWGKDKLDKNYNLPVNCIRGADMVSMQDLPLRYILDKNVSKLLKEKDIVIEISGGSPTQSTGRTVYVSESIINKYGSNIICSNFCQALTMKEKEMSAYFFFMWNMFYDNNVLFNYEGKTTGIKNLLLDIFLANEWYFPPKRIASKFDARINKLFKLRDKNKNTNEILTSYRDFILPMLMNGQVSVK